MNIVDKVIKETELRLNSSKVLLNIKRENKIIKWYKDRKVARQKILNAADSCVIISITPNWVYWAVPVAIIALVVLKLYY